MKNSKRVWIPIIGMFFAKKYPMITLNETWCRYQELSVVVIGTILAYKITFTFFL